MKTLGIKTHKMKNVYTGNHFFLLSKDLNAGKPLNKLSPNCFVPFADCDEEKYHFCKKYVKKFGKKVSSISKPVIIALTQYDWPGNVRELENMAIRSIGSGRLATQNPRANSPTNSIEGKQFSTKRCNA